MIKYIILKINKNLIMNLILIKVNYQEKVDLVKLENVLVNLKNLIVLNILQLKWNMYKQIQKKYYNKVLNNKMIKKINMNLII